MLSSHDSHGSSQSHHTDPSLTPGRDYKGMLVTVCSCSQFIFACLFILFTGLLLVTKECCSQEKQPNIKPRKLWVSNFSSFVAVLLLYQFVNNEVKEAFKHLGTAHGRTRTVEGQGQPPHCKVEEPNKGHHISSTTWAMVLHHSNSAAWLSETSSALNKFSLVFWTNSFWRGLTKLMQG